MVAAPGCGEPIRIIAIYAPAAPRERDAFTAALSITIAAAPHIRTIVAGDFNSTPNPEIDRPSGCSNGIPWAPLAGCLHQFLDITRVYHPSTRIYTFCNALNQRSRIDQIWVSRDLLEQCHCPRVDLAIDSDHRPLSLTLDSGNDRPPATTWRLNTSLLQQDSLRDVTRAALRAPADPERLAAAWSTTKNAITKEARQLGIRLKRQGNLLLDERLPVLKNLEQQDPPPPGSADEATWLQHCIDLREEISTELAARLEGRFIRARAHRIEHGERSNAYFYRCMRARNPRTQLESIFATDGTPLHDTDDIHARMCEFYGKLFGRSTTDPTAQSTLLDCWSSRVSPELHNALEDPITADEIMAAIKMSPRNKAPGPDGLSYELYKAHTDDAVPRLLALYNDCWEGGEIPRAWREGHIILLPKKGDLRDMGNWRPITLSNCDSKILTRVMTARLQAACAVVIGADQTGFIAGRSIFDNIHTVHMAIKCGQLDPDDCHGALAFLDQSKAFDRVDWHYLDRCLETCGVGPKFRRMISRLYEGSSACIRSPRGLSEPFNITRGLRQGDPLSSLLYNLVAEPWLCYLRQHLTGIPLADYTLKMQCFADDVAIALSSDTDVAVLRESIRLHSAASNALVNDSKTELLRIGNPRLTLPFTPSAEPVRYLGIFFTEDGIATEHMQSILLAKIEAQIAGWHDRRLSLMGRALLCNSTLLAKLWFAAHVVPFTDAFLDRVRAVVREFMWGSKRARLDRKITTKPKSAGGLGLLDPAVQSTAIFGTWLADAWRDTGDRRWSATARYYLRTATARYGLQPAAWLYGFPQRLPGQRGGHGPDRFLKHCMGAWRTLSGQTDDHAALRLACLPVSSPLVTEPRSLPLRVRRWLAQNGLLCLGRLHSHLHHQLAPRPGMRTARELLQQSADTYRIRFTPAALAFLDRAPMDMSSAELQSNLHLAGVPLAKYTPQSGRLSLCDPSHTTANYKRWRPDWVAEAESTGWKALHHTPLEPKHVSLLWQLQHGCIPTAKQLQHMSPDNTDKCPPCGNMAADRSTFLPAPEHREDLAHYFYGCARVRRFWLLVGRFLTSTLPPARRRTSLVISPREVAHGFGAWSALIPNHRAWHGLALWQIYRAHTETLFDATTIKTGDAMFARWKHDVMQRIVHDFYTHVPNNRNRGFKARWTTVESAWFSFRPCRRERLETCTLSFAHPSYNPDLPGSPSPIEFTTVVRPRPAPTTAHSTADAPSTTR